jgi:uncharacterized membrane protein YhhN
MTWRMKLRTVDLVLLAALIGGVSFYFTHWMDLAGWPKVVWKGSGVGLLAVWAFSQGRPWIGLVLAVEALGDVLLETSGLIVGAVPFLLGHILALGFYLQSRRGPFYVPVLTAVGVSLAAYLLSGDAGVAFYALALGAMMGAALNSGFARATLGAGAVLLVASDLLIFSKLGPIGHTEFADLLIWPTYFIGQALIAWGVVRSQLREDLHDRI